MVHLLLLAALMDPQVGVDVIADDEIVSIDRCGDGFVCGWGDGTVTMHEWKSGRVELKFHVPKEGLRRGYVVNDRSTPFIAVRNDARESAIDVYSLKDGALQARLALTPGETVDGVLESGKYIVISSPSDGSHARKVKWKKGEQETVAFPRDIASVTGVACVDEYIWVTSTNGTAVQVNPDKVRRVELGGICQPAAIAKSAFVVWVDAQPPAYVALSASKGKVRWELRDAPFGALRAISRDAERQCVWHEGQLTLRDLPDGEIVPIPWSEREAPTCVLLGNGKRLLVTPDLVLVSEAGETRTWARASHVATVFDADGEKVREFEIQK